MRLPSRDHATSSPFSYRSSPSAYCGRRSRTRPVASSRTTTPPRPPGIPCPPSYCAATIDPSQLSTPSSASPKSRTRRARPPPTGYRRTATTPGSPLTATIADPSGVQRTDDQPDVRAAPRAMTLRCPLATSTTPSVGRNAAPADAGAASRSMAQMSKVRMPRRIIRLDADEPAAQQRRERGADGQGKTTGAPHDGDRGFAHSQCVQESVAGFLDGLLRTSPGSAPDCKQALRSVPWTAMRLDAGLSASRFQRSSYDAVRAAFASQRCVVLDGRAAIATAEDIPARHRRYVAAGCDVLSTGAWEPAVSQTAMPHWMEVARRGVRLAREAIAEAGREGEVAVAFVVDAGIVNPDGPETVELLSRALAGEQPDLILIEGLTVVRAPIYSIVDGLRKAGYPVWLSFRRCPEGLCGTYGQHWGGPDADEFGRAAHRFEQIGVDALLVNGIPHDHVDGIVAFLRDYTDLPLGVAPNAPNGLGA